MGYWGTPKVTEALETTEWPRVYRERRERQENGFKRLMDHGALNTTYGRNKIMGPDRQQPRARAQLTQALEATQTRVDKKADAVKASQDKVAASEAKGHGKRLEQRQRAVVSGAQERKDAQHQHAPLAAHASALGPPKERAEREFRNQTIMTLRTRLLENALTSFMAVLLGILNIQVSLDGILRVLFERSGTRMETDSHVI